MPVTEVSVRVAKFFRWNNRMVGPGDAIKVPVAGVQALRNHGLIHPTPALALVSGAGRSGGRRRPERATLHAR